MGLDFSLSAALSAMVKTAPFIITRMLVYFGVAVLFVVSTGAGGAVGYGVTSLGDNGGAGAFYGALVGFAGASGFIYWAREYVLYLVKAGHIAVLVQVHDGMPLPHGQKQITFATEVVKERFAEASILFALDQLIKGVLSVIIGTINTIASFLPIPGLQNLTAIAGGTVRMSLTYVDEIILAYNIRIASQNPWETSRQALVLYAQNYGKMLKNAIWLSLFMWLATLIIFTLLLAPMIGLIALVPGDTGFWGFALAFIFAWAFKAALLEPLAIFALMQVFFKTIEGQQPNPEWDEKLASTSKKFRELKEKAIANVRPKGEQA